MKTNPLKQGVLIEHSCGIGPVTQGMVEERAAELALINGRPTGEVSQSDLDQARRELTGEPPVEPGQALEESIPESDRWDPVPGSAGHKAEVTAGEDEDEEGRSDSERLVQEGVDEAEHDQMLEAAKTNPEEDE